MISNPEHPQSHAPESAGAPQPWWRQSNILAASVLGAFALLSLLIGIFMWDGYVFSFHTKTIFRSMKTARNLGADPALGIDLTERGPNDPALQACQRAIPHLEAMIRLQPNQTKWMRDLGQCLLSTGQTRAALDVFEKMLELNPKQDLNLHLGQCWFALGDADKAADYFEKVIERTRNDPAAHYYLGRMQLNDGRLREAAASLEVAARHEQWDRLAIPYRRQVAERFFASVPETSPSPAPQVE